jgi:hypothetical protein
MFGIIVYLFYIFLWVIAFGFLILTIIFRKRKIGRWVFGVLTVVFGILPYLFFWSLENRCINQQYATQEQFVGEYIDKKNGNILNTESISEIKTPIDTFFFTNTSYSAIGELNKLDMFILDKQNVLHICGKSVGDIQYKIGEGIKDFLSKNIEGIDTMNFNTVENIEWSTDLRGDDIKKFLFKSGKLSEVKNWP